MIIVFGYQNCMQCLDIRLCTAVVGVGTMASVLMIDIIMHVLIINMTFCLTHYSAMTMHCIALTIHRVDDILSMTGYYYPVYLLHDLLELGARHYLTYAKAIISACNR